MMADAEAKILCCPWRPLSSGNVSVLVKAVFTADLCEVLCCDLQYIWKEQSSAAEVIVKIKQLNPTVSGADDVLFAHLTKIVCGATASESTLTISDNLKRLEIDYKSKFSTRVFSWVFDGILCHSDEFKSHFSQPIILMLAESLRREQELCALLRRKDAEVDDYKQAGATLTRKNLETSPFDEREWRDNVPKKKSFGEFLNKSATDPVGLMGQPLAVELYTAVMEGWKLPQPNDLNEETTPSQTQLPVKVVRSASVVKQEEKERRDVLKRQLEAEELEKQNKKKKPKGKLRL